MITDADRRVWQTRAGAVLTCVLDQGQRERLPILEWTLGHAGATLTGRCLAPDPVRRRADWVAWRDALDAMIRPGATVPGREHLWARAVRYGGGVDVVVIADIHEDPPG